MVENINDAPRLLQVKEVCRLTGYSPPYVYKLMENRDLPYIKYGRSRRIAIEDLEKFIAQNRVSARSPAA